MSEPNAVQVVIVGRVVLTPTYTYPSSAPSSTPIERESK